MKHSLIRPLLSLAPIGALLVPGILCAQAPRDRIVVSVDWLASRLSDSNLVLLHVESADGYAAAHIAGARLTTITAVTAPRDSLGLSTEFADDATLERQLETLGVSDSSLVVVTFGGESSASSMRIVSTLYYAGLGARTRWLDGGVPAWIASGKRTTTDIPTPRQGQLTLRPVTDFRVDANWVRAHAGKPGWSVIDARGDAFYDGVREGMGLRGQPGKSGHVPGALSLGMPEIYARDGHIKSTEELRALFTKVGVKPGDTVVAYCHIGVFANSILTAARILGHDVRLYDGSFQDWVIRDLPVTKDR